MVAMRFRLRTLLIVLAIGPPVLAIAYWCAVPLVIVLLAFVTVVLLLATPFALAGLLWLVAKHRPKRLLGFTFGEWIALAGIAVCIWTLCQPAP